MKIDLAVLTLAVQAAQILDEEYTGLMPEESGMAKEFVVECSPGNGYVKVALGDDTLWDTEDENEGEEKETIGGILAHCRENLKALALMYSCFKT
jgi:hypothetical protein